jgi:putative transposase
MLFVYMKCRFSLSYEDLEEMMTIRGANIDHATLQRGVKRFVSLIDKRVRQRKKPVNGSCRMDETYIKCNGKWVYLYRAVDKFGDTIDFLLRAKRDAVAAKDFLKKAFKKNGRPDKVTIDKSGSNKAAIDSFNEDIPEDGQVEVVKRNTSITLLNKIIGLSRNERDQCWDSKNSIQLNKPFLVLKTSE